jgi:murein tripeptide amidase MpaA
MKPLLYSEISAQRYGRGWERCGQDVCYFANSIKRKGTFYYYTLTFSTTFENDFDTVYLAHSYPYTYSDLQRYLNKIESDPRTGDKMQRKILGQTLAGNPCDMLTITTFTDGPERMRNKKGIVISSRVHPGETGASYMMKGVIDFLVGSSVGAKILRDKYIFKIIPMINIDGVINGNSRCSLYGVDLNRCWIDP